MNGALANVRLPKAPLPVSCGTLVVNPAGPLLLCHVTHTARSDIPNHLACTSFFSHQSAGTATPEVDAYHWAARVELAALCWPCMAQWPLALAW